MSALPAQHGTRPVARSQKSRPQRNEKSENSIKDLDPTLPQHGTLRPMAGHLHRRRPAPHHQRLLRPGLRLALRAQRGLLRRRPRRPRLPPPGIRRELDRHRLPLQRLVHGRPGVLEPSHAHRPRPVARPARHRRPLPGAQGPARRRPHHGLQRRWRRRLGPVRRLGPPHRPAPSTASTAATSPDPWTDSNAPWGRLAVGLFSAPPTLSPPAPPHPPAP